MCRLTEERMAREGAASRLRLQEDQLSELQEELRRVSPHTDSLLTVLTLNECVYIYCIKHDCLSF